MVAAVDLVAETAVVEAAVDVEEEMVVVAAAVVVVVVVEVGAE